MASGEGGAESLGFSMGWRVEGEGRRRGGGEGPRGHRLLEFPERPGEIRLMGLPCSITVRGGTVREGAGGGESGRPNEGEGEFSSGLKASLSLVVLSVQIFF